nr:DUF3265 domain-containing protein [Vibrio vulnificus]
MGFVKLNPLCLKHNKAFKRDSPAWHFWFAVFFGGESGLREVGLGGIHPLTGRYATGGYFD